MTSSGSAPTIIVIAFNRVHTLSRLLRSLSVARYPAEQSIPLVISIDQSDAVGVARLADEFPWLHGPKEVIRQQARLGLREHVLRCGDLSESRGAIIMLEDDLTVSSEFYHYAQQALEFYKSNDTIAGISLYNYHLNPHAFDEECACDVRFDPLDDGFDNWFGCFASSWGQAWTADQWKKFRIWLKQRPAGASTSTKLPSDVRQWPDTSWKKDFHGYQAEANRYFVFPRVALSTNWGDKGTHFFSDNARFQSPLLCGEKNWRFSRFTESRSIYDPYFEIAPQCLQAFSSILRDLHFDVDLTGLKDAAVVSSPHVLTIRDAAPLKHSFDLALHPPELNVVHNIPGAILRLVTRDNWLAALDRPIPYAPTKRPNVIARNRMIQANYLSKWQYPLNRVWRKIAPK
jgi:hypothetical protein